MRHLIVVAMLAVIPLWGCSEPEPEEPEAPPAQETPKKTADQLYQETMQQLRGALNPANPKAKAIQTMITGVKSKFRPPGEPNGEEAQVKIKRELNSRIDAANKAGQWRLVIAIAAGLDVFAQGPPERTGELQKINRLRTRAMAELSKPKVAVKGFMDDYVDLQITIPTTGKETSAFVREGDSFLDDPEQPGKKLLRLDDIIGDNREVRIYYYKTDTSWIVKGPRG